MKIYIYALTDVYYYSYYIQGFYDIFGKKNITFTTKNFPKLGIKSCAVIIQDGQKFRRIIIDAYDSDSVNKEWLDWCDIYGKVNLRSDKSYPKNIVNIGPSFGIRIWGLIPTIQKCIFNYYKGRKQITNKREFVALYWRQYNRTRLEEYFKNTSVRQDYIFFISSIWAKEKRTNCARYRFVKTCVNLPNIIFEGGFAIRTDGNSFGLNKFLTPKIPFKNYLKKIRKSELVFNTPAVLDCHGWKIAEFLAMGKAIISTPFFNEMPNPIIHKEHLLFVQDQSEVKSALLEILNNAGFRKKLEEGAKDYFQKFLKPKVVIQKLINS